MPGLWEKISVVKMNTVIGLIHILEAIPILAVLKYFKQIDNDEFFYAGKIPRNSLLML